MALAAKFLEYGATLWPFLSHTAMKQCISQPSMTIVSPTQAKPAKA